MISKSRPLVMVMVGGGGWKIFSYSHGHFSLSRMTQIKRKSESIECAEEMNIKEENTPKDSNIWSENP